MAHVAVVRQKDFSLKSNSYLDSPVHVPISSTLRALWCIATGKFLGVGDHPLADIKQQTINACTNLGLMSALLLTIIVPMLLDAAPGERVSSATLGLACTYHCAV